MTETLPRRKFLLAAAAGTAAVTAGCTSSGTDATASTPAQTSAAVPSGSGASPAAAPGPEPMQVLTATEAAFLGAAADAMIPADELSPSGSECGVVTYIDRQLAGAYGAGARLYQAGPFLQGKPGQGYQLPLAPLDFFRTGIAAANDWTKRTYGKELDRLSPAERDAALKDMESGKAEFSGIGSKPFFAALLNMVMQGFFADPLYGGNRDKASWRMIGYPGLPATYAGKIEEYRGKRYVAEPQSIVDFS